MGQSVCNANSKWFANSGSSSMMDVMLVVEVGVDIDWLDVLSFVWMEMSGGSIKVDSGEEHLTRVESQKS